MKKDNIDNGQTTYVVAVSGGVDSVVLLHILSSSRLVAGEGKPARLIVAHFDHGVRPDSAADKHFVHGLARDYGLPFVSDAGRLGAGVSEAVAREARYKFLRHVMHASQAQAIVMAHHEDDVLETAILNLLRGTGRKGLSSLRTTEEIYRPLLRTPKAHIHTYARKHGLEWREDSTNADTTYLRNYVRLHIMPRFDGEARQKLRDIISQAEGHNQVIDALLADQLQVQVSGSALDRQWFIMLPHIVAREVVAAWLRKVGIRQFDRQLVERIVIAIKTYIPGKIVEVNRQFVVTIGKDEAVVSTPRT